MSCREPSLHVGGLCVELVSELVVGRGCRQGVLQVDSAQVQHLRHQQHWRDGDDSLGAEATRRDAKVSRESVHGAPLERMCRAYWLIVLHLHSSAMLQCTTFCTGNHVNRVPILSWCIG